MPKRRVRRRQIRALRLKRARVNMRKRELARLLKRVKGRRCI